jgi:hypothetical protein
LRHGEPFSSEMDPEVYPSFFQVITPRFYLTQPPHFPITSKDQSHNCKVVAQIHIILPLLPSPNPNQNRQLVGSGSVRTRSRSILLPPFASVTGHPTSHHILPKFSIPPAASRPRFTFLSSAHVTVEVSVTVTVGVGAVVVTPVTPAQEQAL